MREPQLRSMRDRLLRRLLTRTGAPPLPDPAAPAPSPVALAVVAEPVVPARVNLGVAAAPAAVVCAPASDGGVRVLLLSSDRRFRQMAATLLSQRGHDVILPHGDEDAVELARRTHADAVVIDASASLTATARQVARLRALRPRVGVVAVGAESGSGLAALPLLPKWSSFDEVLTAVDRASAVTPSAQEFV